MYLTKVKFTDDILAMTISIYMPSITGKMIDIPAVYMGFLKVEDMTYSFPKEYELYFNRLIMNKNGWYINEILYQDSEIVEMNYLYKAINAGVDDYIGIIEFMDNFGRKGITI